MQDKIYNKTHAAIQQLTQHYKQKPHREPKHHHKTKSQQTTNVSTAPLNGEAKLETLHINTTLTICAHHYQHHAKVYQRYSQMTCRQHTSLGLTHLNGSWLLCLFASLCVRM